MSYLALARKYRPADFDNIISQHHITSTLKNAVKSGRISHAYLFCGPRGTGKTTTARVLAKALNCEKGPTPEPCGVCNSCKEIAQGSSPDVFEIDAASNRGIDDIRELRENVRYSPVGGKSKIYIIDEVHRLTKEAFDALLKTLEEPPAHVVFIFATTDPQALPTTILSRTQRYDFRRIPVSFLADAVNSVALKEGLKIEPGAALLVAKKADGSLRDALSLLDQLSSFSDGMITAEQTAEILGIVKAELLSGIMNAIINHSTKEALDLLGDYIKSGGDSQELADALTGYIRRLLLVKSGVDDADLLELDRAELENIKNMIADIDTVDILRYFTILADHKSMVKQGQDPIYTLEAIIVKMSSMDRAVAIESLLQKSFGGASSGGISNSSQRPATEPRVVKPGRSNKDDQRADIPPSSYNNFAANVEHMDNQNNVTSSKAEINSPLNMELLSSNWLAFCDVVKKNKRVVYVYLSLCNPIKLENNLLTLSVESDNKIQYEQLSKPDYKRFLEDSLKNFYGAELRLAFIQGKATGREASNFIQNTDPDKFFENALDGKDLFEKLGGEIIGQ